MVNDPSNLPEFLRRDQTGARPYRPRARKLVVRAVEQELPAVWRGAPFALVDAYPPEFAPAFPCGRRRVRFLVRPRKGTVRVRANTGEITEVGLRAFERARVYPVLER